MGGCKKQDGYNGENHACRDITTVTISQSPQNRSAITGRVGYDLNGRPIVQRVSKSPLSRREENRRGYRKQRQEAKWFGGGHDSWFDFCSRVQEAELKLCYATDY